MNNLSNNIYGYYLSHFNDLPQDKQLHFASRLFLWSGDQKSEEILRNLRRSITHNEKPDIALREVYDLAQQTIHHGSKNAAAERAPYFTKYPLLRSAVMVLFRLNFLQSVYQIDARSEFFKLFDQADIEKLKTDLLNDDEALAILSTHAINFIYLYHRMLLNDEEGFSPKHLLAVGKNSVYDLNNPIHLQLLIYLYTHCIIGESVFYARKIPAQNLDTYVAMMHDLDTLISKNFRLINLDNKFEFLVCCKIVGVTSNLEYDIFNEAEQSVSETGTFIIDRFNDNPQVANSTLDLSEHRNVLYIMASQPSQLSPNAA